MLGKINSQVTKKNGLHIDLKENLAFFITKYVFDVNGMFIEGSRQFFAISVGFERLTATSVLNSFILVVQYVGSEK